MEFIDAIWDFFKSPLIIALIGGIIGAVITFFTKIVLLWTKGFENWFAFNSFQTHQQANLMNLSRQYAYNSNRVLVRFIKNIPPDDRFSNKMNTSEEFLKSIECEIEKYAFLPKEILYRIQHLVLLIRHSNTDVTNDKSDKNQLDFYHDMFRRFITIALLSDYLENTLSTCSQDSLFKVLWSILIGRLKFVRLESCKLDRSISEIDDINARKCKELYDKYINPRHIQALDGHVTTNIESILRHQKSFGETRQKFKTPKKTKARSRS